MFVNAIKKVSKSIFPIFWDKVVKTNISVGVVGTGFFIDQNGTFLTCNHVIDNIPPGTRKLYLGSIPHQRLTKPITITEIGKDIDRDVYVGNIKASDIEYLTLSTERPDIGKSVCLCGYPLAEISFQKGIVQTNQTRQYYQPSYVLDYMSATITDEGRSQTYNYKGFLTRDESYPGMSGGPVFDIDGVVWGIGGAHWPRKIHNTDKEIINGIVNDGAILKQIIDAVMKK